MPNKTITQRINTEDMPWIRNCIEFYGLKSIAELISLWRKNVILHKQREFYSKITLNEKRQPLKGKCVLKKGSCLQ